MNIFNKKGIRFQYSESWRLLEEEWNEHISILTFEDDNGIYMLDIYSAESEPELDIYAMQNYDHFVKELPFFSKIVDGPNLSNTNEKGVQGILLEFMVSTFFVLRSNYINAIYKISGPKSTSFISGQYPKENSNQSQAFLNLLLGSYEVE